MPNSKELKYSQIATHVVDILGNVTGRDQTIMVMDRAMQLVSMLDRELFVDDETVLLDPFSKAGEILLACAFVRNYYRSQSGKELNETDIEHDIYSNNKYFGIAPDERHYKLSLRTFFGNKRSHITNYTQSIINGGYLSEIDGRLDFKKYQMEFNKMLNYISEKSGKKKIIAIGNPPYQEDDGGAQSSARPIYHLFVNSLIESDLIDEFVLVIPARWFMAGKGLDDFRKSMVNSRNIKSITYFGKSGEVFPTVDIDGGVCFLHWSKKYNDIPIFISNNKQYSIDFKKLDCVPDDPDSIPILEKIRSKWKDKWVYDVAWSSKPFGFRTFHFDRNKRLQKNSKFCIPCLSKGRTINYVSKDEIKKNSSFIDYWKVCAPKAYGGKRGDRRITLPTNHIFLVEKGVITTETYNVINCYKTKSEAELFISYLRTDFCRYLLGLRKITADIPKDRWKWVPLMDISQTWTDEQLFKYFGFSKEEQSHIRKKVQEWS